MRRPKFSIGFAMVAIAIIGIGLFLLSRPTPLGAAVTCTFASVSFTLATVAAIYRCGSSRAYWLGFAIGGWSYVFLLLCRSLISSMMTGGTSMALTVALLDAAYPYIVANDTSPRASGLFVAAPVVAEPVLVANTGSEPSTLSGAPVGPSIAAETTSFAKRWMEIDRPRPEPSEGLVGSTCYYEIGHGLSALIFALGVGSFARFLQTRRDHTAAPTHPVGLSQTLAEVSTPASPEDRR